MHKPKESRSLQPPLFYLFARLHTSVKETSTSIEKCCVDERQMKTICKVINLGDRLVLNFDRSSYWVGKG